jgi:hypothetical protein
VNLLNSSSQAPGPYDPSFESYTSGATVSWLTAVGATTPVVGTTTPNSGSQDVGWSVVNGTTVQGVSYQVPCIPGQQYTSSVYVRQAAASTQSLRVTDQNTAVDNFNRTTASGWGTSDYVGGAWTNTGGSGSDYTTAPGTGVPPTGIGYHAHNATNTVHTTTIASVADSNQLVLITVPVVATGAEIDAGVYSRYVDGSNHYVGEIQLGTDSSVTARVRKNVTGTFSTVGSAAGAPFTYAAGSQIWLRLITNGPALMLRTWLYGTAEPTSWLVNTTDTSFTAAGPVGCRSVLATGNTNTLPVSVGFQLCSVTGSVVGGSTSTTGSYQRLTITWTATQPLHTIQLATSGTAVAGAVLLDDVQHEPGSSASTAATTGPVIYGVHRGYVERWPSTWQFHGYYGVIGQLATVDGFAALAARKVHSAIRSSIMVLNPDFYWPLGEASGATTFADATGKPNPSLIRAASTFGASVAPAAGTAYGAAGDPNGAGVMFTPGTSPTSTTQNATVLGAGRVPGAAPTAAVAVPARLGSPWGMTAACWVNANPTSPASSAIPVIAFNKIIGSQYVVPIQLTIFSGGSFTVNYNNIVNGVGGGIGGSGGGSVLDGKPHVLVGTISQDGTNTVIKAYVDGVQVDTATGSTGTIGGILAVPSSAVEVGGLWDTLSCTSILNGVVAHAALWNRVLSSSEITNLWTAGQGYVGEGSGARITRYLNSTGYTGPTAVDTGQSTMGADTAAEGTNLLTAALGVSTTENGNLWFSGAGTVTFTSRTRRYTTTTAKWTFGELENPYLPDVAYDFDPQLVYNDVTAQNASGAQPEAVDAASQSAYGPRTLTRTLNTQYDTEATDAANWLLSTHKAPHQRINTLTIEPASNPSLWPVALGVAIGDRITVKRRTQVFTMSADYFVESIAHNQGPGAWTVSLQASPASLWATPWILGDATYGVLGSTTILGY